MKQSVIEKAMQIKKLLDSGKLTSKQAQKSMNNEFIVLGGKYENK